MFKNLVRVYSQFLFPIFCAIIVILYLTYAYKHMIHRKIDLQVHMLYSVGDQSFATLKCVF